MENIEKITPFSPLSPAKPENFVGREDIIQLYTRELSQVILGNPAHFFIIGNRGMGKSSLADYLIKCAETKYNMLGVHVYNNGTHTTEDLITKIMEQILSKISTEKWSNKIINKFKENIDSVGIFGTSIKFKTQNNIANDVMESFDTFLVDLISHFEDKKGIFIVVDDVNGLSENSEFTSWFKSFADSLASNYRNRAPISFMLTGYPEKYDALYNHDPSFSRIFISRYLENLESNDVENFFKKNFNSVGIEIKPTALKNLVYFSGGIPIMMQEIGNSVFWINNSNCITNITAIKGLLKANENIYINYLKRVISSLMDDKKHLLFFNKLGKNYLDKNYPFKNDDLTHNGVYNESLEKIMEMGIIEHNPAKDFIFTNELYGLYFAILSLKNN